MGPVWAYWAFPMERFCGAIARSNKSRRYPYSSINRHVLQVAQLSQIKLTYGMTEELDLEQRRSNIASGTSYPAYSDLVFVSPSRHQCIHPKLIDPVATFLGRHTRLPERVVRRALVAREFTSWGKMQRVVRSDTGDITGGDLIRGHHIVGSQARETRDATHVQVSTTPFFSTLTLMLPVVLLNHLVLAMEWWPCNPPCSTRAQLRARRTFSSDRS
jgi:hypothetical protein